MVKLMNVKDLAELLGMSPAALRMRRYRDPESVPPPIELGGRKLRWHPDDVEAWLKSRRPAVAQAQSPSDYSNGAGSGASDGQ